jgi:hypothetical protein
MKTVEAEMQNDIADLRCLTPEGPADSSPIEDKMQNDIADLCLTPEGVRRKTCFFPVFHNNCTSQLPARKFEPVGGGSCQMFSRGGDRGG